MSLASNNAENIPLIPTYRNNPSNIFGDAYNNLSETQKTTIKSLLNQMKSSSRDEANNMLQILKDIVESNPSMLSRFNNKGFRRSRKNRKQRRTRQKNRR
jgi:hypothetical protein